MAAIQWVGLCLSVFGMYGLVFSVRYLLPYYIIPDVSSKLSKAEQSIAYAVTIGAIPEMNEFRQDIEILANQFASMRTESHRSPELFPQIWLAVRHGLTRRLLSLASQIRHVDQRVEMVTDEHLFSEVVVVAQVPAPAGDVAIPLTQIAEPAAAHIAEPAHPPPPMILTLVN